MKRGIITPEINYIIKLIRKVFRDEYHKNVEINQMSDGTLNFRVDGCQIGRILHNGKTNEFEIQLLIKDDTHWLRYLTFDEIVRLLPFWKRRYDDILKNRQKIIGLYCTNCDAKITPNQKYCTHCGTKIYF